MIGRDRHEEHRAATTLELFFDLIYVIAIAAAASGLHHHLAEGHYGEGVAAYVVAILCIFNAWYSYSYFASAYDNDDFFFRILSFVQIFGALVFAVGVPKIFQGESGYTIGVIGYVIMRLGLVSQWLRAGLSDRSRRKICFSYAIAISILQLGWVLRQSLPEEWKTPAMVMLFILEFSTFPLIEHRYMLPWHPHHIAERYGLLVIIVLGESVLGVANAVGNMIDQAGEVRWFSEVLPLGLGAMALVFVLWWSYFKLPYAMALHRAPRKIFIFNYAHLFIYFALGAVGAGLELVADAVRHGHGMLEGHGVSAPLAINVVSISLCIYLLALSVLRMTMCPSSRYHILSFVLALTLPGVPPVLIYLGCDLPWTLLASILAPVSYIILCDISRYVSVEIAESNR